MFRSHSVVMSVVRDPFFECCECSEKFHRKAPPLKDALWLPKSAEVLRESRDIRTHGTSNKARANQPNANQWGETGRNGSDGHALACLGACDVGEQGPHGAP